VFSTTKISSVTITGNEGTFSGTAQVANAGTAAVRNANGKHQITFTVHVTDNGMPGTSDTFSITTSDEYSASGNLIDGDIQVH
jgi:hypothetical protein